MNRETSEVPAPYPTGIYRIDRIDGSLVRSRALVRDQRALPVSFPENRQSFVLRPTKHVMIALEPTDEERVAIRAAELSARYPRVWLELEAARGPDQERLIAMFRAGDEVALQSETYSLHAKDSVAEQEAAFEGQKRTRRAEIQSAYERGYYHAVRTLYPKAAFIHIFEEERCARCGQFHANHPSDYCKAPVLQYGGLLLQAIDENLEPEIQQGTETFEYEALEISSHTNRRRLWSMLARAAKERGFTRVFATLDSL